MKLKFRILKNKLKLRFSEKIFFFKKWLKKKWDQFVEKGHERMTIMLIPHNEKRIFNFQISKFTILFFIFLFVVVLGTSTYAYIRNAEVKSKERKLLMSYNDIRSVLLNYEKITHEVGSTLNDIKPDIEEIYELSAGSEDKDNLWKLKADEKRLKELNKIKNILPYEIFKLNKIKKDMQCSINTARTVKNFIKARSDVIHRIPHDVPNYGHITSLFGWRRDPFGHGRDFHYGIDIAAARGTPIRATAPGEVVHAGWGGGYGKMIRIKHKYGFETVYAHCQSLNVEVGKTVQKGQVIAYVGMTGNATGNHCHYEVRLGNQPINPYPYMSRIW